MNGLNIPVGISDFEKIRKDGFYYIDKTGLIAELLSNIAEVTLITRPRRFGKTLGMSMLESFFDIRKDNSDLFDGLEISQRQDLCAVWSGDSERLTREMTILLRKTISYHDYKEDFYHAFLAGIFTGAGYMVDSNKEHGDGRSDVVVYDSVNSRVAIFEAKYTKNLNELENECDKALQQIDSRMYAKEYEDDYDQILCYGISFFKKRCMVKKK